MQLGVEVDENLGLLARAVNGVADGGILCGEVLLGRHVDARLFLHVLCAAHQGFDVMSGHGDRQQTYRRQHRETAAYVVGNNERLVALFGSQAAERAFPGVGHGHDATLRLGFAAVFLKHGLQQTERESGLGRGARFGDVDDAELLALQELHEVGQVVLADVVAGIDHVRILATHGLIGVEGVLQSVVNGFRAEIRASDTGYHHHLATLAKVVGYGLYLVQKCVGNAARQVYPADVVVAGSFAGFQQFVCACCLRHGSSKSDLRHKAGCVFQIQLHII